MCEPDLRRSCHVVLCWLIVGGVLCVQASSGVNQTSLRDFCYTPRSARVNQFRPHHSSTSSLMPDVEFFRRRNNVVDVAAATAGDMI